VTAFGRPPAAGTNGTLAHAPLMAGKSVQITEDAGGMGKTTAIGLAVPGARVGITGRDPARSQAAAENIRAASAVTPARSLSAAMASRPGESRRRFRLGECYGPVADGMKARSWRCPDYAAQDAHGERRVTARYAMLCSAGAAC
jgi:hypothetical protein